VKVLKGKATRDGKKKNTARLKRREEERKLNKEKQK
jgi:hypothetical protein